MSQEHVRARLALAQYRARHRYIDKAIEELRQSCPDPSPIEEVQKATAKYIKGTTLSELVIKDRGGD